MVNRRADPLDAVFGALAHPARRRMLQRLTEGAASVGELAAPFSMSAPAISKHVRVLERAGLVRRERDGRLHRMDLSGGALGEALLWLDRNHRFWTARLDALAALLEAPESTPPSPLTSSTEDAWPRSAPPAPASASRSSARSRRARSASSTRSRRRSS